MKSAGTEFVMSRHLIGSGYVTCRQAWMSVRADSSMVQSSQHTSLLLYIVLLLDAKDPAFARWCV